MERLGRSGTFDNTTEIDYGVGRCRHQHSPISPVPITDSPSNPTLPARCLTNPLDRSNSPTTPPTKLAPMEMLYPAVYNQQQSNFQPMMTEHYVAPSTVASLLDGVWSFWANQPTLTPYPEEKAMQIGEPEVDKAVAGEDQGWIRVLVSTTRQRGHFVVIIKSFGPPYCMAFFETATPHLPPLNYLSCRQESLSTPLLGASHLTLVTNSIHTQSTTVLASSYTRCIFSPPSDRNLKSGQVAFCLVHSKVSAWNSELQSDEEGTNHRYHLDALYRHCFRDRNFR